MFETKPGIRDKKMIKGLLITILVAGLLDQIRLRNSPKGRIAFLSLDDNTGRIDIAGLNLIETVRAMPIAIDGHEPDQALGGVQFAQWIE